MATVQVGSVWPTGSTLTITGPATITGQAITGAQPGAAFGTPSVRTVWHQNVGGVGTAQVFGAVTLYQQIAVHPAGLGSPAAFGVPVIRLGGRTIPVGSVASAAAFGALKLNQAIVVGGVGSAQQFGSSLRINQIVHVQGFYSYATYAPSITGQVISGDGHVVGGSGGPGSLFGAVTIHATITTAVGGVLSAAAFGAPKLVQIVHPMPVPSAAAFGARLGWILGVWGLPSAQQFGTPRVFIVWMREEVCEDIDLAPAECEEIDLVEAPVLVFDLDPATCT